MSFTSLCATYVVVFLEAFEGLKEAVSEQVRNFSRVRNKDVVTKITIDGLLDMLLLPASWSGFLGLDVRLRR